MNVLRTWTRIIRCSLQSNMTRVREISIVITAQDICSLASIFYFLKDAIERMQNKLQEVSDTTSSAYGKWLKMEVICMYFCLFSDLIYLPLFTMLISLNFTYPRLCECSVVHCWSRIFKEYMTHSK